MTERLFLDDPTLARVDATVLSSAPEGIVLDRTIFYAGRRPARRCRHAVVGRR